MQFNSIASNVETEDENIDPNMYHGTEEPPVQGVRDEHLTTQMLFLKYNFNFDFAWILKLELGQA